MKLYRISLSKKHRLVAKLEEMVGRGEEASPLEHMREIFARDSVLLGDLEKILARAQVAALGERRDVVIALKAMREIVARDSAKLAVLEQLLAGTNVAIRLKEDSLKMDTRISSLSSILDKSINICFGTIINRDEKMQSYCGTPPLPNNTNAGEKQKALPSISSLPTKAITQLRSDRHNLIS
nr:hypothetical protein [Tanacetum cinerariifolium]